MLVQSPPLLLSTATTPSPMTFMVNTCPNAFKPPLVDIEWVRAVRLHDASCSVIFGEGAAPWALASGYERALCY